MANFVTKDGAAATKYLKATGTGTDEDPLIIEHTEANSAAILTAIGDVEAALGDLATATDQVTANTALAAIQAAVEALDNAISGNELQVDIVSSALPTGAATAANQDTQITHLAAIEAAVEALDSSTLPTGAATAANQDTANTALAAIQAAVEAGATETTLDAVVTALGNLLTELQAKTEPANTQTISGAVTLGAAIPAGDNNIGNVDIVTMPNVTIGAAIPAGTNNIGDVDVLTVALPTTVYNGQTNVTTAGTQVALASSQAILSGVTVKAKSTNTGLIYVGATGVTSSNGFILSAGDSVFLEVANLSTVFLNSSVNGEGVSYFAS